MIRGVFFDVGGTLYSYRNLQSTNRALMSDLTEALDLECDVAEVAGHYQLATREVDTLVAGKAFYLFRDYFELVFLSFLKRINKSHLLNHFASFEVHQRMALMDCLELKPDCHETLGCLKNMGLYLSAVSNSDANMLTPLIERAQLDRWLTHWTSSEEARSCKPDRRFFEIALEKSGLSPDQVLFVGDSLEQDIQGAHAAGMTTLLISETDEPAPMHTGRETPEPDFRLTALSGLPGIIESLRTR